MATLDLDVFVGTISKLGLITAFWDVVSVEVAGAGVVVVKFISEALDLDSREG